MSLGVGLGMKLSAYPRWDPTALSGLTLLLDASFGVTASSNLVSNWTNRGSGGDVTAAGAARPTYAATGGPNGGPCLIADGANSVMAGSALGNYIATNAFTFFGVVYIATNGTAPGASRWLCPSFLGDSYTYLGTPIDSTPQMGMFVYSAGTYVANQAAPLASWFRFIGKLSGGTLSMSINGAAATTAAGANVELVTGSPVLRVFRQSGSTTVDGKIRAIGALNRATTVDEDALLNLWMQRLGG